jgi:hypothetical protein
VQVEMGAGCLIYPVVSIGSLRCREGGTLVDFSSNSRWSLESCPSPELPQSCRPSRIELLPSLRLSEKDMQREDQSQSQCEVHITRWSGRLSHYKGVRN